LFLVLCGLPFLIPEGEINGLEDFLETGFYAIGVVSFMVLHIKRNLGATMAATTSGLRGVFFAVCNAWFLFGLFPDGYTNEESDLVWWFGLLEGFGFVFVLVFLNFDTGAVIFSIKLFAGYWMLFLRPDQTGFKTPFTPGFSLKKNKGIQDLTCVVLGSILTLLVFILPFPLTALDSAKEVAAEMTHEVPKILRLFVEFLETNKSNPYQQDRIQRHIRRLHSESGNLASNIQHAWWECFGCGHRQTDRWALSVLEQSLHKTYDAIQGIWAVSELTKTEARSEKHVALINVIKAHFLPVLDKVEVLLVTIVSVDSLIRFTPADADKVKSLIEQIKAEQGSFRQAFWEERARIMSDANDDDSTMQSINEVRVIHVVAFNLMTIVRGCVEFAEQILKQHDGDVANLHKVREIDALRSLFHGVATWDNVRYVLRVVLSVMLSFFLGYFGGGFVAPGTAAIAKATATLLTKYQGSALVKNLNRVQGVVLGTVFGQLVDTIFHRSITCQYTYVNETLLGAVFALFMFVTLFVHFHVDDFAIMGLQMANFGGQEMLVGSCGEEQDAEALQSVTVNLLAIGFLVLVDLVFAQERASDMAAATAFKSWSAIKHNLLVALDSEMLEVHFSRKEILDALAKTESLGAEAANEPRYWRTEWRAHMFNAALKEVHDVRYALSNLENAMTEGGQDGSVKAAYFQQMLKTKAMPEFKLHLSIKFDVVSKLLEVFCHETSQRWTALDDEATTRQFRDETSRMEHAVLKEIIGLKGFLAKEVFLRSGSTVERTKKGMKTFRDDPLCQLSILLASCDAMLLSMRQIQHHILQLY